MMDAFSLVRITLALFSLVLVLAIMVYACWRAANVPEQIPGSEFQDQRRKAMEIRLSLSEKVFELAMLLLGLVWGLVLAGHIQVKPSRWADWILFGSSNVLLLCSLGSHFLYKRQLSALLWDLAPHVPDIRSEHVDYMFRGQLMFFFGSLLVGALTVFSVKILGGK